jgi:hypothetical protein
MSNFLFLAWAWCATNGVVMDLKTEPRFEFLDRCDGRGYQLTEWRVQGVRRPTDAEIRAMQPAADAKAKVVADSAKDAAASVDKADVRLRAAIIEICTELEQIKAVIRTVHPATSNAIPAKTMAQWGAEIKAKARELQDGP